MQKIIVFMFLLFVISCSSLDGETASKTPYQQYSSYFDALQKNNYDDALGLMSNYNIDRFNDVKNDESFSYFFPFFSSVDSMIENEKDYYQVFSKTKSCLTIIGISGNGDPVSINFELLYESKVWKFNLIHVIYHGVSDELPTSAACPKSP